MNATVDTVTIAGRDYRQVGPDSFRAICGRCSGRGGMHYYMHMHNGICFECKGATLVGPARTQEHIERLAVNREKAAAKRQAKALADAEKAFAETQAAVAAWKSENADLYADIMAYDGSSTTVNDMKASIDNGHFPSDKAIGWAQEAIAQKKANAKRDFVGNVGDKITFTAKVVFTKSIDTQFGYSCLAVLENDEGIFKSFGTAKVLWELEKDEVVTLTATVKAHDEYQGDRQTVITRAKKA